MTIKRLLILIVISVTFLLIGAVALGLLLFPEARSGTLGLVRTTVSKESCAIRGGKWFQLCSPVCPPNYFGGSCAYRTVDAGKPCIDNSECTTKRCISGSAGVHEGYCDEWTINIRDQWCTLSRGQSACMAF